MINCQGCGDLMMPRSDAIAMCVVCRELRDNVMWARARELKAQLDEDKLSDWPRNPLHSTIMRTQSDYTSALMQFDDIVRPYWRECSKPPRTW